MSKYNISYIVNGQKIEKNNIDEKEMKEFLLTLKAEKDSSLRVSKIKEIEEEER